MLIELFLLGVTAEVLLTNDWKSALLKGVGQFRPNFHVIGGVTTNHFCTDRWANEWLTTLSL